jgi:hypothetical protein
MVGERGIEGREKEKYYVFLNLSLKFILQMTYYNLMK